MTTVSRPNKDAIVKSLDIYRDAMRPFIIRNLRGVQGSNPRDLISYSLHGRTVNPNNLESGIDVNDFPILVRDYWSSAFSVAFGNDRSVQNALWQIKEARNMASHPGSQDIDAEYTRAHIFHIADALGRINAPHEREAVERVRDELFSVVEQSSAIPVDSEGEAATEQEPAQRRPRSSSDLAPWRSVIRINPDVTQGEFQQSEFAADLQMVYDGRADATHYGNPVSFFNHTFITPGIRTLLVNTLKRLADNGGEPVIQTKTGFGGGKTHSLIALYHLVNSVGALTNPAALSADSASTSADIRGMMEEAGLNPDMGLDAKVAVLDCTFLSPTSSSMTDSGDPLNTLWGEMAWQLGGQEGYEIVGEAARRGTAPAGQLDELFQRVGPCVILIDELVAYIRNAEEVEDRIYTFIQNLTQAARRSRRVSLVITLPEHAIEAGGDRGIQALNTLDNILGRIEATWEPLEVSEAFEVVRRRLFGNVVDEAERDRTCEAFSAMYARNRSDYPQGVSEQRYLQRMKDCYPIHPEIFERLYSDWSSIPQFQRTRGVLRMMATCISRLNLREDSSPMIMPASLTLDDPALANEFVRLLDGNWLPVVYEADSDGSRTDDIDGRVQRFADVGGAARRIARTAFLGSAPTGNVRGVDMRQIRLGTVQPGHGAAVYNEAIGRMAEDLYHFYSGDGRYYFHVEQNLNKVAADRAGTVTDRETRDEIRRVMDDAVGRRSDVVVFPASSGDVPDAESVRLVILPPDKSLPSRAQEENRAEAAALDILRNRDDGARIRKNTLLFLVPRRDETRRLDRAVRNYLAWSSIQSGDRRVENLEGVRRRQVVDSLRQAESEVSNALVNAYRWAIAPFQPDARDSSTFTMNPMTIDAQDTGRLVDSAFAKFAEEEALIDSISPAALADMLQQYIWTPDRDHVSIGELWNMLTANVYMHRLRNKEVLDTCIGRGVPESAFGYAEGYNPDADVEQYKDMRFGESLPEGLSGPMADPVYGLLINPEMALLVKEERDRRRQEESETPTDDESDDDTGTDDNGGGNGGEDGPVIIQPTPTKLIVNKTAQGDLSPDDFRVMHEEIIRDLNRVGGEVTVSITVNATKPEGFSDNELRAIRENSRQLELKLEEIL